MADPVQASLSDLLGIKFEDLPQKDFVSMPSAEILGVQGGQAYRARVGQASSSSSGFVTLTGPDGTFSSGSDINQVAVSLPYFSSTLNNLNKTLTEPIRISRLPIGSDKTPGIVNIYNDGSLVPGIIQQVPTQTGMLRAIAKAMEGAVTPETLPRASTTEPGIVRLDNNTASLSQDTAPTSLALKTVSDAVTALESAPVEASRLPNATQNVPGIAQFARYGIDAPSATQMVSSADLNLVATAPIPLNRLPEGTLQAKGLLQLSSDFATSTDQSKAATIGAVHSVYELVAQAGAQTPGSYSEGGGFVVAAGPDASGVLSTNPNGIQTADGRTFSSIPTYDQVNRIVSYLGTAPVASSRLTGVISSERLPEATRDNLGAVKVYTSSAVPTDSTYDRLVPTVAMIRANIDSGGTSGAVRYDIIQGLNNQQQIYARTNIGFDATVKNTIVPSMAVRYDASQNLSESAKQIARNNIGAAATGSGGSFGFYGWVTGDLGQEVSYVPLTYAAMTSHLQMLRGNLMPTVGVGSTSTMAESSWIPSAGAVMRWIATLIPAYAGMIYNTMIPSMAVRYDAIQTLSAQQKEVARANIGVTSTGATVGAATPTEAGIVFVDTIPEVDALYASDAAKPDSWMIETMDGVVKGSVTTAPGWAFYGITQVPSNRALTYEGFTSMWNSLIPCYTAMLITSLIPRYSSGGSSQNNVSQKEAVGIPPGSTTNRLYTPAPIDWRDKVPSEANYQEWYPDPSKDITGYFTDLGNGAAYTSIPWNKNATFGTVITILSSMIPSMMLYLEETLVPKCSGVNSGVQMDGSMAGNNGVMARNMIAPANMATYPPPTGSSSRDMWYSCIPSMKAVYRMIRSLIPSATSWGGVWDAD